MRDTSRSALTLLHLVGCNAKNAVAGCNKQGLLLTSSPVWLLTFHSAAWLGTCVGGVAGCRFASLALPLVVLQNVKLRGHADVARFCRRCTLMRAEHVVLLRSLSNVPLPFWATSRYPDFVRLVSLLMPLVFSGAVSLLFLSWL